MAIDASALTDWTPAQLRLFAKHIFATVSVGGQSVSHNGHSIERPTIADGMKLLEVADKLEPVDDDSSGGIALVRYGERV